MNYTKTIRNYCLENKGRIFDVSYLKEHSFEMVPYKTLLKILNRLVEEGILSDISKGIYLINQEGITLEAAVFNQYIAENRGMYTGYALYNQLGISSYKSDVIEIYTYLLSVPHKTIGPFKLTRLNLHFSEQTTSLVALLECLENCGKIKDLEIDRLLNLTFEAPKFYSDLNFSWITQDRKYKRATVNSLSEILKNLGVKNDCLGIFERNAAK